ncbi:MAG: hypothetical protein ACQEUN_16650 [Pseudomonadota bacterium]
MKRVIGYGLKEIISEYLDIGEGYEIRAHMQHGFYMKDKLTNWYLDPSASFMLVWNKRMEKMWREATDVPVAICGAPFVLYRQMKGLSTADNSQGTVVFPHHSTESISPQFDLGAYSEELMRLEKEFQPITVCLYYKDYKVYRSAYEKYGFNVVTAGPPGDQRFVERFYNILLNNRYATSNDIGSAAFYAVEAGIPFFLLGRKPKALNTKTGKEQILGEFYESAYDLFDGNIGQSAHEKLQFVKRECGLDDALSPGEIRKQLFATPGAIESKLSC